MTANLICLSCVLLSIEKSFNQKQRVNYPTKINAILLFILPVKVEDTMCYLIYCVKVGYFGPMQVV